MIEWPIIIPIIAVVVQGSIAIFIAWYGQRKTARDIEELKHKLSERRFFKEKWWNEAKSAYIDLAKTCQEIAFSMDEAKVMVSGESLYPLTLAYIVYKLETYAPIQALENEFEIASPKEKEEIQNIEVMYHPEKLARLSEELRDMSVLLSLVASTEIFVLYSDIGKLTRSFLDRLSLEIGKMMHESSRRTLSTQEDFVKRVFADPQTGFFAKCDKSEKRSLEVIGSEFRQKWAQVSMKMRAELFAHRFDRE